MISQTEEILLLVHLAGMLALPARGLAWTAVNNSVFFPSIFLQFFKQPHVKQYNKLWVGRIMQIAIGALTNMSLYRTKLSLDPNQGTGVKESE